MDKTRRIGRGLFLAVSLGFMAVSIAGCTRAFYRNQVDREVSDILVEKDKYPEWKIEQYHVESDPRARTADPSNPNRPPMPPDDEAVWKMSPHPQGPGHAGVGTVQSTGYLEMIKAWDAENLAERQAAEDRAKQDASVPVTAIHPIKAYLEEPLRAQQKGFLLKMDQAIELGVVNSHQYQNFREQLYLAALPVTQQRYNFAYQWAATADWVRQWAGPKASGGPQNNWTGSSTLGFSKLFATGALLSADFVNTTAFNFVGNGMTSVSTVNLNLAQPFLQGGGKAVTLEPLTQAERNLFYSIRAYARFREQFNVAITLGSSLPGSLTSAAGTGGSSSSPISALAALGIASTDVSGGFVGYLSTLYRECDLAADQKWAHDLQEGLKIIEAYQEGGFYSPLQVDQVRSTLLSAQNTVLADRQFVANGLDQFKLVLGLPANLPLILDDTPARPITRLLDHYYEVIDDSSKASRRVEKVEKQELLAAKEMRAFLFEMFTNETTSPLVRGTEFRGKFPASWEKWRAAKGKDFQDRTEKFSKERRDLFNLKTDQELKGQVFSAENERKLREANFEYDLGALEKELRGYDAEPWLKLPKERGRDRQIDLSRNVVFKAKDVLTYARNERFEDASAHWPVVAPAPLGELDLVVADVDVAQEEAVKAALENRFDLMNARAQVVDAWRQLKVTANGLLGVATAQYTLQSQTPPGSRPLAFASDATSQQLRLNFQLPLNRLAQRNAYRAAQINYQVARRNLIALEDSIASQVRFDVRQLQLFVANYRIQKRIVHSLYKQVDSALDVIVAPTDPDALKGSGTSAQANAAALTQQYLGALGSLNNSQVKMYDIWLSIYATRMQLYLDLERLPLDLRGVWVDESGASPTSPADPRQTSRDIERWAATPGASVGGPARGRPVFLSPYAVSD
jgi:hypothetical protein